MNRSQIERSIALDEHLEHLGQPDLAAKRKMVPSGLSAYWLIDLADKTGAVEGVLHHALERLVGEPVELRTIKGEHWQAQGCHMPMTYGDGPTRLDAIVDAIMRHGR